MNTLTPDTLPDALAPASPYVLQPLPVRQVFLTAQLDYEREKGRLAELNAVAEFLPPAVFRARRRLRLDELEEARGHYAAAQQELRLARQEQHFPATDAFARR